MRKQNICTSTLLGFFCAFMHIQSDHNSYCPLGGVLARYHHYIWLDCLGPLKTLSQYHLAFTQLQLICHTLPFCLSKNLIREKDVFLSPRENRTFLQRVEHIFNEQLCILAKVSLLKKSMEYVCNLSSYICPSF